VGELLKALFPALISAVLLLVEDLVIHVHDCSQMTAVFPPEGYMEPLVVTTSVYILQYFGLYAQWVLSYLIRRSFELIYNVCMPLGT
jgi:hypothetical protein